MEPPPRKSLLDQSFKVGIALKGIDGILETVGGLLILRVSRRAMNRIVAALTQHELSEDPHDLIATHLLRASHEFAHRGRLLPSLYLFSHGVAKVVLVTGLLLDKLWAYPVMIGLLALFIAYQIYRISYSHSLALALLTVFDLAIVLLTWREYRQRKKLRGGWQ